MKRIIIIEDDLVVANIYSNKLRTEGYEVQMAHDGETGWKLVSSLKPHLVLLDLNLPKVNGVEVLKRIRATPELKAVPVFVFSNVYLSGLATEAWKAGATKCISKIDCTPKQMVEMVNKALAEAAPPAAPQVVYVAQPAAPAPKAEDLSDEAFQAELRATFLQGGPQTTSALRAALRNFSRSETDADRLARLLDLNRQARQLAGNAGIVGLKQMARLASALEALLKELYEKPANLNASTLRTVAQTVDFLGALFERGTSVEAEQAAPINILVVDDEILSRRAVVHALGKVDLKSINVEDPLVALQLVHENRFDLIILDVDMPGLTGFQLCEKIRQLPQHVTTPVVFVTSHSDFESRAQSIMSGGNDLIGKPFLFMELAVKAFVHLLRQRTGKSLPAKRDPSPAPGNTAPPAA
jgi:DNA-binding response OmpR family regulator